MGIIDIVLIVIAVITLIIGLWKGATGVLLGFIGTLVIAVGVAICVALLTPTITYQDPKIGLQNDESVNYGYTSMFYSLFKPINNSISSGENEILNAQLIKENDTLVLYGAFGENGEMTTKKFSEVVVESVPFMSNILGADSLSFLDSILLKYGKEGMTVSHSLSQMATTVAMGAIFWFVGFLVLFIIKRVLRHVLFKFLDSHSLASKIDRLVGMVLMVAVVVVIAWAAISFVDHNANVYGIAESFDGVLEKNAIMKFFAQHSFFGERPPALDSSENGEALSIIRQFAENSIRNTL